MHPTLSLKSRCDTYTRFHYAVSICWLMLIALFSLGLAANPLNRSIDTDLVKMQSILILID
jgi:energy-converting hydrogenase Eha subunit G